MKDMLQKANYNIGLCFFEHCCNVDVLPVGFLFRNIFKLVFRTGAKYACTYCLGSTIPVLWLISTVVY